MIASPQSVAEKVAAAGDNAARRRTLEHVLYVAKDDPQASHRLDRNAKLMTILRLRGLWPPRGA